MCFGPGNAALPLQNSVQEPLFECSFHEILDEFFTKIVEKGAAKKVRRQTSNRQTDRQNRADLEQLRRRVLDSQNADTIRKNLQNVSPKQDPEFS